MHVEDAIDIDAPVDLVWGVTEDIARWPEWTPTVTAVQRLDEGPVRVGSRARLRQPGLPPAVWEVTELSPCRRFAWRTRVRGIGMVGTHELVATGRGTRNRLVLEMSGIVALTVWPLLRRPVLQSLRRENAGLKAHCEQMATATR